MRTYRNSYVTTVLLICILYLSMHYGVIKIMVYRTGCIVCVSTIVYSVFAKFESLESLGRLASLALEPRQRSRPFPFALLPLALRV